MSNMECDPCKIRIHSVIEESIVDGEGIRYVVFTQGCPHHCPGCHNPETHDFAGGELWQIDNAICALKENPLLCGITLSGGEPFCQPRACAVLAEETHRLGRDVWAFSGYTLEQLQEISLYDVDVARLLRAVDVLVDGPYLEAERDLTLAFRGSRNQRVLYLHDGNLKNNHMI